jgi:hypothetical protein
MTLIKAMGQKRLLRQFASLGCSGQPEKAPENQSNLIALTGEIFVII